MDINKEWQKLEQARSNQSPIKKEEIMQAIQLESTSTIAELKKRLGQKINWIIFFIVLFLAVAAFNYSNLGVVAIMGLATVLYGVGYIVIKQEHKKLISHDEANLSVLDTLKANREAIVSALKKERLFGIVALPIMLVVGLSFGPLQKGYSFAEIFEREYNLYAILVIAFLIIILGFGAEKMNKIAFGGYIEKLNVQINALEKVS